jgi:hypothetical protein
LTNFAENLKSQLIHCFRILSIFACVAEETIPPNPPVSKINFSPIPSSPQQLKKRFENSNESNNLTNSDSSVSASRDSLAISTSNPTEKEKKANRTLLGAFGNNPSMMKLFELIRTAYQTQKSLLNSSETDRFGLLLATTLDSLKSVLNLVTIQDIFKHLEETLNYLKSTFNLDKIRTIHCTQELLQNLHQLAVSSQTPSEPKPSISPSPPPTSIHTITIRQPMIYLFGSQHTLSLSSDQSVENSTIREYVMIFAGERIQ